MTIALVDNSPVLIIGAVGGGGGGSGDLLAANNLSDLLNKATARTNLELGTAATEDIADFLQAANNLSDVVAATARTNLGLGTAATQATTDFLQKANNLSDLLSAPTARNNLGLGTAATQATTDFLQTANNLSDVVAATARTNLGLGTAATQATADFLQKANNLSDLLSAPTARTNLATATTPTFILAIGIPVTTGTNKTNALIAPRACTINKAFAYAKTGPTGADLIFDVNLNGSTIWSSQANRLKIVASAISGNQSSFNTTAVAEGDILTIDVDQVGSTIAGQDITVTFLVIG